MRSVGVRRGIVTVVGLLALTAFGTARPSASSVAAQGAVLPWELLELPGPVYQLYTVSNGSLFARTDSGLHRSDDGGAGWTQVLAPDSEPSASAPGAPTLAPTYQPRGPSHIAVHPTDPNAIYAATIDGLAKTTDGGTTWNTVVPLQSSANSIRGLLVAVSPADPNLVFFTVAGYPQSTNNQLMRSRDGGATRENIYPRQQGGPSPESLVILLPHPSDPMQVFTSWGYSHRSGTEALHRCVDQGTDYPAAVGTSVLRVSGRIGRITGDRRTGRLYASHSWAHPANDRPIREVGTAVHISDDGETWSLIASMVSQGTPGLEPNGLQIAAIAPAPENPNWMYLGINQPNVPRGSVKALRDPRNSADLTGEMNVARVADLAMSAQGDYLYAATERGIWRLADPAKQPSS